MRLNCCSMSRFDSDSDSNGKDYRREKFKSKKNWNKNSREDDGYLNKQASKSYKKEIKEKKESMLEEEIWDDWEEYKK